MNIEKLYEKFIEDFWSKQCYNDPCINTQSYDWDYLDGTEAFYNFIKEKKK